MYAFTKDGLLYAVRIFSCNILDDLAQDEIELPDALIEDVFGHERFDYE